jgi:hypothetical protein
MTQCKLEAILSSPTIYGSQIMALNIEEFLILEARHLFFFFEKRS